MEESSIPQPVVQAEETITSQHQQAPVKNKRHIFLLVVGLLILLVLGAIYFLTFYKGKSLQGKQELQILTKTKPIPSNAIVTSEVENLKAISGDAKLTYFFNPQDNQKIILKQVDFNTNISKDIVLPFFTENNRDENKRGKYKLSPNSKYIVRITSKKLEIADLLNPQNIVFNTIHIVPEMKSSVSREGLDYAAMGDVMWDDQGTMYFTTQVGLDGVSNPFGFYTELYVADEDGSNKKLINDRTKNDQNYGFMKSFGYIDSSRKEIYFRGLSHGGHATPILVVDAVSGQEKGTLQEVSGDALINDDFSKAYFSTDATDQTGDIYPVKLYEYNLHTKLKKLIYEVDNFENYMDQINYDMYLTQNKLFFDVSKGKAQHSYFIDLITGKKSELFLYDTKRSCSRGGISSKGDYIFIICSTSKRKSIEYHLYQVSSGIRSTFYKEDHAEDYQEPSIQVVSFL